MILKYLNQTWEALNKIHPETRSVIIILLFGCVLYTQISDRTYRQLWEKHAEEEQLEKKAEQYSIDTGIDINREVQRIAEIDDEAFDVLLLNYHNNTQSLQGYKYLYLSCLTEASKSLDNHTLKQQWNRIDYIYYADELTKIHNQSFVQFRNIDLMKSNFPKLYRLVIASDAKAASFFTLEGPDVPIGLIVILYKEYKHYDQSFAKKILPSIQRLALLLDYNKVKK